MHLREDRRHIQDRDVRVLRETVSGVFNLEMAATEEMLAIALATKPDFCTLVPEKRAERTTEGGLDVKAGGLLEKVVRGLEAGGHRGEPVHRSRSRPSSRPRTRSAPGTVELHTGDYCLAAPRSAAAGQAAAAPRARGARGGRRRRCASARATGSTTPTSAPSRRSPRLEELNIGHGLVARAVMIGLPAAVAELQAAIAAGARP